MNSNKGLVIIDQLSEADAHWGEPYIDYPIIGFVEKETWVAYYIRIVNLCKFRERRNLTIKKPFKGRIYR